jgi:hypothetical protein
LRKQPSNFFASQRNRLVVAVQLIKLGTEIEGVNSWIIIFQNKKMPFSQENVVFRNNLPFQGSHGDAKFCSGVADNGPCLKKNNPILRRDVIGMDGNVVTGNRPFEDAHIPALLIKLGASCAWNRPPPCCDSAAPAKDTV